MLSLLSLSLCVCCLVCTAWKELKLSIVLFPVVFYLLKRKKRVKTAEQKSGRSSSAGSAKNAFAFLPPSVRREVKGLSELLLLLQRFSDILIFLEDF